MDAIENFADSIMSRAIEVGMAPAATKREITTVTCSRIAHFLSVTCRVESKNLIKEELDPRS